MNRSELRALAEAATPGPWVVRAGDRERPWSGEMKDRNRYVCSGEIVDRRFNVKGGHVATVEWHVDDSEIADADFIAAADPSTVIALLDRLEAAEAIIRGLVYAHVPKEHRESGEFGSWSSAIGFLEDTP